jgi:mannosyl-oligosaccharide alpha-1,2-mannosidase
MLRLRRYRVFLFFAIVTVLAFYRFSGSSSWHPSTDFAHGDHNTVKYTNEDAHVKSSEDRKPPAEKQHDGGNAVKESLKAVATRWKDMEGQVVVKETKSLKIDVPLAETSRAIETPPPLPKVERPAQKTPPPDLKEKPKAHGTKTRTLYHTGTAEFPDLDDLKHPELVGGEGRVDVEPLPTTAEVIHWVQQSEHFPVPPESTIQLPRGTPRSIPKIQHDFKPETPDAKSDRESKLEVIREAFVHTWNGYREFAFEHDEVKPVSGKFRDPFAHWRATLVDALDTMWIMGLKDEFEEAVEACKLIDFTTTPRNDIPLFETTIRYLGGFLGAYDVSGRKYRVLLDKAVELAEVLMGAFDTPNRMPLTYYNWKP